MLIHLKLFADLRKYLPEGSELITADVQADKGATVESVLSELGVPLDHCRLILVNGLTYVEREQWLVIELKDGDSLAVLSKMH